MENWEGIMLIVGEYSFNDGKKFISKRYDRLLEDIKDIIKEINSSKCKTKVSKEKTMSGKILYSPVTLNEAFKNEFRRRGWEKKRVKCEYPEEFYTLNYRPKELKKGAFREMDFVKEKLGVEVQFGKYAFMVYNVGAKMTIFHKLGFIDAGVEIVPVKQFADEMSKGVSYFEQFVWDLQMRGVADIDIPVLILGIK